MDTVYTLTDALQNERCRAISSNEIIEALWRDVESHDTPKQLARDWKAAPGLTARIETWIKAKREVRGVSA